MTFHLALHAGAPFDLDPAVAAEGSLEAIALHGCARMEDAGWRFTAGGFGDERWPVDVRFDLAAIIPQLPDLLAALEGAREAELDFFEQGIDRTVTMRPRPGTPDVLLHCSSNANWSPAQPDEVAPMVDLQRMMRDLAHAFAAGIAVAQPSWAQASPLREWLTAGP
ncbi:hypothetical protein ACQP00_25180 [Dactylosporangium sp. CS-047395]|uniref:hypothetical protein n=1 Tax=Dactylosporangium sp. CS-047395 TaxID=3239936 RepID=UPI003D94D4DA